MAKDEEQDSSEYQRPDAAKAFEIYDRQIAPKLAHLATLKGDLSQPYDDIKEQARFPRKVLNFIIGLEGEEDAKRDHLLLALAEGLKHRKLFLPRDLVTMASGEDGDDVVPIGDQPASDGLATLDDDDDEDGLFGGDDDEPGDEDDEPAPGTGAAAIAAMNKPRRRAAANALN